MNSEDFKRSFDALTFSSDFNEKTTRLLQQTLAASESRKEQSKMKRKKLTGKGKVILIAATLALVLAVTASAAAIRFTLPQRAAEFMNIEGGHISEILADGTFDAAGITAVKQAVRSNGHTIVFEGITEGVQLKADIFSVLAGMNGGDISDIETTAVDVTYAVLSVTNDAGGPVLGLDPVYELHSELGCSLCVQGIEPIDLHYGGQFIDVDDVVYMFIPLNDAAIFADRELRLCVYGSFAPFSNILTMDKDGLPAFKRAYNGIQASFEIDLDDSLADHDAVAALEAERPFLPTEWEISHGLAG
ncbi:MAG: hypothetical protein IJK23_05485 [Clostridia bacterium]|nr:hypothetical protein [Clostridia bacterium]